MSHLHSFSTALVSTHPTHTADYSVHPAAEHGQEDTADPTNKAASLRAAGTPAENSVS